MWLTHDNWIFHSQTQSLQYSHILFNLKMTALKQKYFGNSFDIFLILTQWFKSLYKCDIVTWWFPDFLCNYSVFITGINSIIQQYTEKADSRSTTPQFSLHNQSTVTNQIIGNHEFENITQNFQHFDLPVILIFELSVLMVL